MIEKYHEWRDRTEREFLLKALVRNGWNISWTSTELGLHRQTLLGRVKRLGIERPKEIQRTFHGHLVTTYRTTGVISKLEDYQLRKK